MLPIIIIMKNQYFPFLVGIVKMRLVYANSCVYLQYTLGTKGTHKYRKLCMYTNSKNLHGIPKKNWITTSLHTD